MDPFTKDVVQVAAWCAAIIGGLVAAFKAIHETAQNRRQRTRELRWNKAQLAREILDKLHSNKRFHDALVMLDWTGRDYEIAPGQLQEIRWEDLPTALRAWHEPISFDEKEVYIRDCFDDLFDGFNLLEHYLRTDLLDFDDVEFPMAYHVGKLRERWDAVSVFINHYGFRRAVAFVDRFPVLTVPPLATVDGASQVAPAVSEHSAHSIPVSN
jgi:hypothetical protein